jgi:NhaP-type Na+/H+ and K+/H+ antiporter
VVYVAFPLVAVFEHTLTYFQLLFHSVYLSLALLSAFLLKYLPKKAQVLDKQNHLDSHVNLTPISG